MAETLNARTPSFSPQSSQKPRVRTIQFGDGYMGRLGDGLNTMPIQISVPWNSLTGNEFAYIIGFLQSHQGRRWFWWNGFPGLKWICPNWTWKRTDGSGFNNPRYDLTAEFIQVFDLADSL